MRLILSPNLLFSMAERMQSSFEKLDRRENTRNIIDLLSSSAQKKYHARVQEGTTKQETQLIPKGEIEIELQTSHSTVTFCLPHEKTLSLELPHLAQFLQREKLERTTSTMALTLLTQQDNALMLGEMKSPFPCILPINLWAQDPKKQQEIEDLFSKLPPHCFCLSPMNYPNIQVKEEQVILDVEESSEKIIQEALLALKNKPQIIIMIAGGSGSGKTFLTDQIRKLLKSKNISTSQLYEDDFYITKEERTRRGLEDFDHPDCIEHDLLHEVLRQWPEGKEILTPKYSMQQSDREGTHKLSPSQVLLLDGRLTLYKQELRECADLNIYCHSEELTRFKRRILRDTFSGRKNNPPFINFYYASLAHLRHHEFVEKTKQDAHMIINNNKHLPSTGIAFWK